MSKPILHLYIDVDDNNKLSDFMFTIDLLDIDVDIRSVSHFDNDGIVCQKKYDSELRQTMYGFNISSLSIKREIFSEKLIVPYIYHCRLSEFDHTILAKSKNKIITEHNYIYLDGFVDNLETVFTPDYSNFISTPATAFTLYEYHNAEWTENERIVKQFIINTKNNDYDVTDSNIDKFKWLMWCGHNNIKVR